MALASQIESDLRVAMKARDTDTVSTLRLVLAAVKNARVGTGRTDELSDDETTDLLNREAKKRAEAVDVYGQAGREELAAKERRELEVIRRYLPEQLSEEELAGIVDTAVAETGASSPSDLGRVMSAVMPRVKGRADGKQVNALVRARLG